MPPLGLATHITGQDQLLTDGVMIPNASILLSSSFILSQNARGTVYGLEVVGTFCPVSILNGGTPGK